MTLAEIHRNLVEAKGLMDEIKEEFDELSAHEVFVINHAYAELMRGITLVERHMALSKSSSTLT